VCAIARPQPLISAASASRLVTFRLCAAFEVRGELAAAPLPEGHLDGRFLKALAVLFGKDAAELSAS
jgi:hypothetical protein